MATPKSPFFILQNFISPLLCEQLVDECAFDFPDVNVDDKPIKMIRSSEKNQQILYDRIDPIMFTIEKYYNIEYYGMENMSFEWLTTGVEPNLHCENSQYLRKKWVRTINRDFTGVLFLSSYQEKTPFDNDYEVYGGKLEFPQHHFGFNPEMGTLIFFPSCPHFINQYSDILAGDLYVTKIHFACKRPFLYNPEDFPGDYTNWFNSIS